MAPTATSRRQLALDVFAAPTVSRGPAERVGAAPAAPLRARVASATASHVPAAATAGAGTLDDLLNGTWRALGAQRVGTCLVCGSVMRRAEGARGGHCGSCGSSLT